MSFHDIRLTQLSDRSALPQESWQRTAEEGEFTAPAAFDNATWLLRPIPRLGSALQLRVGSRILYPLHGLTLTVDLGGRRRLTDTPVDNLPCHWDDAESYDGTVRVLGTFKLAHEICQVEAVWTCFRQSVTLSLNGRDDRCARVALPPREPYGTRSIPIPYLDTGSQFDPGAIYLVMGEGSLRGTFISTYFDWAVSNATSLVDRRAIYEPSSQGVRNRLAERITVSASRSLDDVLPRGGGERSKYADDLSTRVLLDSAWPSLFDDEAALWRQLGQFGLTDIVAIRHVWQRKGYDEGYPNVMPANEELGGDVGLRRLAQTAQKLGWRFGLHENYVGAFPGEVGTDEDWFLRSRRGVPITCMRGPESGEEGWLVKPEKARVIAEQWSPRIHSSYGTSATFLDVHSRVPPWQMIDQRASSEGRCSFDPDEHPFAALFDFERECHNGPVLGEGGMHFVWRNAVDAVEAEVAGGELSPLIVDFAHRYLNPHFVSYGLGYYVRWRRSGDGESALSREELCRYRSTQLGFGHAGFIACQMLAHDLREAVKEYYLFRSIQPYYVARLPTAILYEVDGSLVGVEAALLAGFPDRLYLRFPTGFQAWINRADDPWEIDGPPLPMNGWYGSHRDAVSLSALFDGTRIEAAATSTSLLVDAPEEEDLAVTIGRITVTGCTLFRASRGGLHVMPIAPGPEWRCRLGWSGMAHVQGLDGDGRVVRSFDAFEGIELEDEPNLASWRVGVERMTWWPNPPDIAASIDLAR